MEEIIELAGISTRGFHGVYDWEREVGQIFIVDATCTLNRSDRADDIETTMDYARLAVEIEQTVAGKPVALLETLAGQLVELCLAKPYVVRAAVRVRKPEVELSGNAAVSVLATGSRLL